MAGPFLTQALRGKGGGHSKTVLGRQKRKVEKLSPLLLNSEAGSSNRDVVRLRGMEEERTMHYDQGEQVWPE